jgi:hypothetical protein
VSSAALVLHKLPGDVSLLFVLQSISVQEQRRAGGEPTHAETEVDLRAMGARCILTDYSGEALSLEQTVGDVPDPGVIVAVFYESAEGDDGRAAQELPTEEVRRVVLQVAQQDTEISFKMHRHLKSPDATLRGRFEAATG